MRRLEVWGLSRLTHGYLAQNQLTKLCNASPVHVEATVATTLSIARRKFSWVWIDQDRRALLANRLTGTLFDPETGRALNAEPEIQGAPVNVPPMLWREDRELPYGVFATAQV